VSDIAFVRDYMPVPVTSCLMERLVKRWGCGYVSKKFICFY